MCGSGYRRSEHYFIFGFRLRTITQHCSSFTRIIHVMTLLSDKCRQQQNAVIFITLRILSMLEAIRSTVSGERKTLLQACTWEAEYRPGIGRDKVGETHSSPDRSGKYILIVNPLPDCKHRYQVRLEA